MSSTADTDAACLDGVPTAFFEAYPFPAFLLRVRSPGRVTSRPLHRASRSGSPATPPNESPSPGSAEYTLPQAFKEKKTWDPSNLIQVVAEPGPAPVSVPGSKPMWVIWGNAHWNALAKDEPLGTLLDRHQFYALQEWAENNTPRAARNVFSLRLGKARLKLDLVKTRLPQDPNALVSRVMVTTMAIVSDQAESDHVVSPPPSAEPPPSDTTSGLLRPQPQSCPPRQLVEQRTPPVEPKRKLYPQNFESLGSIGERIHSTPQCHVLFEEFDWSKTSAGPRHLWPPEINSAIQLVFTSVHQDSVWIGKDLHVIYSNSSVGMVNHPEAFGKSIKEIWGTFWNTLGPMVERAVAGEPVVHECDRILFYHKDTDRYIERYHSLSFLPIFDSKHQVVAVYNPTSDHTERILAQRRLETTRALVEKVSSASSSEQFYQYVADVIEENPADAPFMLFYSVKELDSGTGNSATVEVETHLESTVGVPDGHASAPSSRRLSFRRFPATPELKPEQPRSYNIPGLIPSGARGYKGDDWEAPPPKVQTPRGTPEERRIWSLQEALETHQCVIVNDIQDIIAGYPVRQWDALPDKAVVVPITNTNEESNDVTPAALLILGLNLYRPLDAEYDDWIQQIRGHLASSLSSVHALEEEIRRREARERLEQAQQAWFRGAAHEFRTPLTLIAGPLDDLSQTVLSMSQRKALGLAQRNVIRLTQLVSAFLDFTRMEAGRVQANFVPINMPEFVSDLASLFAPAMQRLNIDFKIEIEPREAKVVVDPVLLEMVVSNLLSNALKFTPKGRVTLKLDFDDFANITVSDTGLGIHADEVENVTDWFHRSKDIENVIPEGSGVGLALVREVIKLHDGELEVTSLHRDESSTNHGSTFKARFPLTLTSTAAVAQTVELGNYGRQMAKDMAHMADASTDSHDSGSSSAASVLEGFIFDRSDTLLIVDDEQSVLSYISSIFRPYCNVIEASSVEEALRLIKDHKPDLVLADILLGSRTGLELLAQLKSDPATRLIPVVCCSAANDDELRVAALVGGADDFISKPFKPRELILRVHLHMQLGKKRANLELKFKQREQEMAVLSDYCPSGIVRTDAQGDVVYVNTAFRDAAKICYSHPIQCWWENAEADEIPRIEAAWNEIVHGDEATTNMQWRWSQGKTMAGVFIRLDKLKPNLSGIIGCINDISYQEERLQEAERRRIEAEESKWQQDLLVDLTSHEIRTPVSAILQCSSLVKENLSALSDQLHGSKKNGFYPSPQLLHELEEDIEALESIYQCGLVQERIAGDILSFARIQLNMLTLQDVEFELQHEVRKVLSVFSSEARSKNIKIRLIIGSSLKRLKVSRIKTDPVRLGQVFTNLISNAIRFTSGSSVRDITVRYDVSLKPPAEDSFAMPPRTFQVDAPLPPDSPIYLYASVTDTGAGMMPQEMAGLFQRFHQGNKNIHTHYGGSGLGLFICRKITEMLGGGIDVTSELGKGSTFRFCVQALTGTPRTPVPSARQPSTPQDVRRSPRLPDESSHKTLAGVTADLQADESQSSVPEDEDGYTGGEVAEMPHARRTSSNNTAVFSGLDKSPPERLSEGEQLHVLIVEDNVINQTVLKRQMVKAGVTCAVAGNGQEALDAIHSVEQQRLQGDMSGVFDVILMDVEMPVMDGLTAVKHVREMEESGDLPRQIVFALTGNARQGQIEQAINAGMDEVVIKPYRLPNLLEKMREAVAHRQQESQAEET